MNTAVKMAIHERINDLRNYRAHVQLFPRQLPPGVIVSEELSKISIHINTLRQQLIAGVPS